jgi:hypothetical protein
LRQAESSQLMDFSAYLGCTPASSDDQAALVVAGVPSSEPGRPLSFRPLVEARQRAARSRTSTSALSRSFAKPWVAHHRDVDAD